MFIPKVFAEEDHDRQLELIRNAGVGIVVSHGEDGLIATHAPIELDTSPESGVRLRCHFAKPNPHGQAVAAGDELLVIFQGPQAYISPGWYPTKRETEKVVPTWNYAAVHAYGTGQVYDDTGKLRRHLEAITNHFERGSEHPWQVGDAPDEFIAQMMRGVAAIEIEVTRLEGKWKMSQNRPEKDRVGVVEGLRARAGDQDEQVAGLVQSALDGAGK